MPHVIVDDRANIIFYNGPWNHNTGVHQEFQSSTSQSFQTGASFSFTFEGTAVSVYGSLGFGAPTSCTFSIDGGTPTPFSTNSTDVQVHHINFFSSPTPLSSGQHTLTMIYTDSTTGSNLFWDYIIYTSLSNTSSNPGSESLFIDDSDSQLQYSGSWGTGDGTEQNMQSTLHTAAATGSSVTMQFEGTSYQVFGQLSNATDISAIATIAIDGGAETQASLGDTSPPAGEDFTANYVLWPQTQVADGPHTLVITAEADNVLFLDYILISPSTNSSLGSSSNSSGSDGGGGGNDGGSALHANTGAIAGGVAGGIVGLAILGLLIWFLLRARKSVKEIQTADPATRENLHGASYSSTQLLPNHDTPGRTQQPQMYLPRPYIVTAPISKYTSSNLRGGANQKALNGAAQHANAYYPQVDGDSGTRRGGDGERLTAELPPHYTPE